MLLPQGGEPRGQQASRLSLSWANYNIPRVGTDEETVVCCGRVEGRDSAGAAQGWGGVTMYYPRHLQDFYRHRASSQPQGRWRMLQRVLEDHVDAIRFHEWTESDEAFAGARHGTGPAGATCAGATCAGAAAGGGGAVAAAGGLGGQTVVPVTMPEWAAEMLCCQEVSSTSWHDSCNDLWLSFLTTSAHPLLRVAVGETPGVAVRSWSASCVHSQAEGPHPPARGEATAASITLFFKLEKEQELVRRKVASLQRLMQCKLFVGQVCSVYCVRCVCSARVYRVVSVGPWAAVRSCKGGGQW